MHESASMVLLSTWMSSAMARVNRLHRESFGDPAVFFFSARESICLQNETSIGAKPQRDRFGPVGGDAN